VTCYGTRFFFFVDPRPLRSAPIWATAGRTSGQPWLSPLLGLGVAFNLGGSRPPPSYSPAGLVRNMNWETVNRSATPPVEHTSQP
jgi:hypothetical protein